MPAGREFTDSACLPRASYPALIAELKWKRFAQTTLNQIMDKKYPDAISEYTGRILLAGINYDLKTRLHTCHIQEIQK